MTSNAERLRQARAMWRYVGEDRPPFAVVPKPGQESVWDYPRPPRLAPDSREIVVSIDDIQIARTRQAIRVLETASPPTFYLPVADVDMRRLRRAAGESFCEWKGAAGYWSVEIDGRVLGSLAWSYERPLAGFESLLGHIGFYPAPLRCTVDGERVLPQPGRFYAGWITKEVVGPFKGDPDSSGW